MKEFKPALLFLARFVAIYLLGNIVYGVYIESQGNSPDHITKEVTYEVSGLLQILGFNASTIPNPNGPTMLLKEDDRIVVSTFEGCNGVNVAIVFIAFLVAFGGPFKKALWFVPLGVLLIHLLNLIRISLLYYSALYATEYFYYFHKFVFTAILYVLVFGLWAYWVVKVYGTKAFRASPDQ
jgi:exosortase family protein XrtF